jgi:hypothetical protein
MAEIFVQAYKFHLIMHNFASADRLYIKGQNALQERGRGQLAAEK